MAKEYAVPFYQSKSWQDTRRAYLSYKHYTCERCGNYADMVHHRRYIKPSTINDCSVTLDWKNLEALCNDCHNKEHKSRKLNKRYNFDQDGNII